MATVTRRVAAILAPLVTAIALTAPTAQAGTHHAARTTTTRMSVPASPATYRLDLTVPTSTTKGASVSVRVPGKAPSKVSVRKAHGHAQRHIVLTTRPRAGRLAITAVSTHNAPRPTTVVVTRLGAHRSTVIYTIDRTGRLTRMGAASAEGGEAGASGEAGDVSAPAGVSWTSGAWTSDAIDAQGAKHFGAFRGRAVDLATVYQIRDSWSTIATSTWAVHQYAGWKGQLAIGTPLLPTNGDGTLADVAAGRHDADFTSFARMLLAEGRGNAIIRLGWEFNGNWEPWSAYDATTFTAAFRRVVGDIRAVAPGVTIDWCGNFGVSQAGHDPFTELYPGDDVVDIVGVDAYETQWHKVTTAAQWQDYRTTPGGLDAWHSFALAHHKKFSVPEWGLFSATTGSTGDNPYYITKMHDYFTEVAPDLAYEAYFNESQSYIADSLYGPTQMPLAATTYATLWH
jgi:hypothetical protein